MVRPWPKPTAQTERTPEQIQRSRDAYKRRAIGRRVEQVVEHRLRALGLAMVEKINVEQRQVRGQTLYAKRVAGDFRAVTVGGIAVLVEVKHRDADHLKYSDLEPHQRSALDEYVRLGALALLVWARGADIRVMRWADVRGYVAEPRDSLPWEIGFGKPGLGAADFALKALR